MRIGFNCLHMVPGQLGGLETFMHGLLEDVGQVPASHELVLFTSSRYRSEFAKYEQRFELIDLDVEIHSAARRIRFEQFALPKIAARQGIDLLHSSGYTGPMTRRCKTVMSVHDLNYLEIPQLIRRSHGSARWAALRILGPMSMKHADKILTISNHVRHRITQVLGIPPERIATVHARSPCDFSKLTAEPVSLPPMCSEGFLLYVGSWLPHKNHDLLFQALSFAARQNRHLPPLVLAGLHLRSPDERSALRTLLQRYGIEQRVHTIEQHLTLANLADLYQRASIFVFPTLFEGFGIPVVEAMSAKVPVVCSAIQPLIEVIDQCALTFDPHQPQELMDRVLSVHENPTLRDQLIGKGYRRFLTLQHEAQLAGSKFMEIYESLRS